MTTSFSHAYSGPGEIGSATDPSPTPAEAYTQTLNRDCLIPYRASNSIKESGASEIATLVASNKIILKDFLSAYDKSCDYYAALKVSTGQVANDINMSQAFQQLAFRQCPVEINNWIKPDGALKIAKLASAGKLNLKDFISAWDHGCNYEIDLEIATGVINKTTDLNAYNTIVYRDKKCSHDPVHYPKPLSALKISKKVAAGTLDLKTFISIYDINCDFYGAESTAQAAAQNK